MADEAPRRRRAEIGDAGVQPSLAAAPQPMPAAVARQVEIHIAVKHLAAPTIGGGEAEATKTIADPPPAAAERLPVKEVINRVQKYLGFKVDPDKVRRARQIAYDIRQGKRDQLAEVLKKSGNPDRPNREKRTE